MAHLLVRFLIEVGFASLWIGIPTAKVVGPMQHLRLGEPRALRERGDVLARELAVRCQAGVHPPLQLHRELILEARRHFRLIYRLS